MSVMETVGAATRLKGADLSQPDEGVAFELEYGRDRYGITLSNQEMDQLLDLGYAEIMGRQALIGSAFVIELENPDLPLFAMPLSVDIEKERRGSPTVSLGVGIISQSHVYEHRGILLAHRHRLDGSWEFSRYDVEPPLREPEEVFDSA